MISADDLHGLISVGFGQLLLIIRLIECMHEWTRENLLQQLELSKRRIPRRHAAAGRRLPDPWRTAAPKRRLGAYRQDGRARVATPISQHAAGLPLRWRDGLQGGRRHACDAFVHAFLNPVEAFDY